MSVAAKIMPSAALSDGVEKVFTAVVDLGDIEDFVPSLPSVSATVERVEKSSLRDLDTVVDYMKKATIDSHAREQRLRRMTLVAKIAIGILMLLEMTSVGLFNFVFTDIDPRIRGLVCGATPLVAAVVVHIVHVIEGLGRTAHHIYILNSKAREQICEKYLKAKEDSRVDGAEYGIIRDIFMKTLEETRSLKSGSHASLISVA